MAARLAPLQVLVAAANSAAFVPLRVAVVMFNVALPELVIVMVVAGLVVFSVVFGKVTRVAGVKVTPGVAGARPSPVSARLCGLPEASSVISKLA